MKIVKHIKSGCFFKIALTALLIGGVHSLLGQAAFKQVEVPEVAVLFDVFDGDYQLPLENAPLIISKGVGGPLGTTPPNYNASNITMHLFNEGHASAYTLPYPITDFAAYKNLFPNYGGINWNTTYALSERYPNVQLFPITFFDSNPYTHGPHPLIVEKTNYDPVTKTFNPFGANPDNVNSGDPDGPLGPNTAFNAGWNHTHAGALGAVLVDREGTANDVVVVAVSSESANRVTIDFNTAEIKAYQNPVNNYPIVLSEGSTIAYPHFFLKYYDLGLSLNPYPRASDCANYSSGSVQFNNASHPSSDYHGSFFKFEISHAAYTGGTTVVPPPAVGYYPFGSEVTGLGEPEIRNGTYYYMVEVYEPEFSGDSYGTLYVPGHDPIYIQNLDISERLYLAWRADQPSSYSNNSPPLGSLVFSAGGGSSGYSSIKIKYHILWQQGWDSHEDGHKYSFATNAIIPWGDQSTMNSKNITGQWGHYYNQANINPYDLNGKVKILPISWPEEGYGIGNGKVGSYTVGTVLRTDILSGNKYVYFSINNSDFNNYKKIKMVRVDINDLNDNTKYYIYKNDNFTTQSMPFSYLPAGKTFADHESLQIAGPVAPSIVDGNTKKLIKFPDGSWEIPSDRIINAENFVFNMAYLKQKASYLALDTVSLGGPSDSKKALQNWKWHPGNIGDSGIPVTQSFFKYLISSGGVAYIHPTLGLCYLHGKYTNTGGFRWSSYTVQAMQNDHDMTEEEAYEVLSMDDFQPGWCFLFDLGEWTWLDAGWENQYDQGYVVTLRESYDLVNWSEPKIVYELDDHDDTVQYPQFYSADGTSSSDLNGDYFYTFIRGNLPGMPGIPNEYHGSIYYKKVKIEVNSKSEDLDNLNSSSNAKWTNMLTSPRVWTYRTGGTPSSLTGPSGGMSGSQYLYFETSNNSTAGNQAILQYNQLLDNSSHQYVLDFNYHMYGSQIGYLAVQVHPCDAAGNLLAGQSWVTIWEKNGQQHTSHTAAYTNVRIPLQYIREYPNGQLYENTIKDRPFKVRVVATAVGGYMGDTAIDDLKVVKY